MFTSSTRRVMAVASILFCCGCGSSTLRQDITAESLGLNCEVIRLTPDGNQLCTWSATGGVQCVEARDLSYGATLPSVGTLLACGTDSEGQLLVAADAQTPDRVEFHCVPTKETLGAMQYGSRHMRFSPDGVYVILDIGDSRFARRRLADLKDKLEFRAGESSRLAKTMDFQISPERTTLTMVDADGGVVVADWMEGTLVGKREIVLEGSPRYCAFSPSSNRVALGSKNTLVVWDVPSAKRLDQWSLPPGQNPQQCAFIDEAHLVCVNGTELQLATIGSGTLQTWYSHPESVEALVANGTHAFFLDRTKLLHAVAFP